MRIVRVSALLLSSLIGSVFTADAQSTPTTQTKPPITLDEFMNATEILGAKISPDGAAVVISTGAPDWQRNRFKEDLWLWTKQSGMVTALTTSGHDSLPQWSPDGKMIAFASDRPLPGASVSEDDSKDGTSRVWLIPVGGGEAMPLYREKLDTHAFAWASDGKSVVFSV